MHNKAWKHQIKALYLQNSLLNFKFSFRRLPWFSNYSFYFPLLLKLFRSISSVNSLLSTLMDSFWFSCIMASLLSIWCCLLFPLSVSEISISPSFLPYVLDCFSVSFADFSSFQLQIWKFLYGNMACSQAPCSSLYTRFLDLNSKWPAIPKFLPPT